jgi:hypothetical protein
MSELWCDPATGQQVQRKLLGSCSYGRLHVRQKCSFGSCDKRAMERLRNECLRDGGRADYFVGSGQIS